MKKPVYLLFILLISAALFFLPAYAEEENEWKEKPSITHIYELSKGKILLEWQGNASLYQVYVDGEKAASVNLPNTVIDLKSGIHQITVIPSAAISKEGGNAVSIDLQVEGLAEILKLLHIPGLVNLGDIALGLDIDLGKFGIDAKDLLLGNPSDTVKINYTPNSITDSRPEILSAYTASDERVILSFSDRYDSNIYRIFIRSGKDMSFVEFDTTDKDAAALISKEKSTVTVTLDPVYLTNHECMIPELDQKYSFSVKLQKWPVDFIDGTKNTDIVLESKESKAYDYMPHAAWKNSPIITNASQTADGQITLQWEHDDNGLGCEYKIMMQDTVLGVKKGENEVGRTAGKEFTINDLINGKYTFTVIPRLSAEEGIASEPVTAEVKNSWATAPALQCTADDTNQILLKWTAAEGVESYHITVSAGSGSLLRFVNLDYKVYEEFDLAATAGEMSHTYIYDLPIDPKNGTSLKFEMYGIRHAADGSEQKSASASKTITLK